MHLFCQMPLTSSSYLVPQTVIIRGIFVASAIHVPKSSSFVLNRTLRCRDDFAGFDGAQEFSWYWAHQPQPLLGYIVILPYDHNLACSFHWPRIIVTNSLRRLCIVLLPALRCLQLSGAWTPKVSKLMAFMAVIMGLGLLFYILLGFR